jgi:alkanesulfonate monooxygenase SsuD/methylene tetrahydromethanopterin reductase-like flavin-dependent oxidoreductase (luciferase family)
MTTLSILDLVRVTEDTDARGALDNARDIAVHAEAWGYRRIWVAEHHHRQCRDVGCDWSYRSGNKHHPRRRGRHHAPQPRSLRYRRAVRDAGKCGEVRHN